MPVYVIERTFAEQLDLSEDDVRLIEEVNADEGVRWLFSFLSADRRRSYCLYEAPSADAIVAAARRANVPADAVVYAGFPDVRRLAEIPGLEDLADRLEPARAHLSGAAAVYVDRHGDWVFLARLTRLAALVAGGEVENGAFVAAVASRLLRG